MFESLLERRDQADVERLSNEIKTALADHHHWMHKISLAIAARKPIDEPSFIAEDAHQYCNFGLWIDSILKDKDFQTHAFTRIDQLHKTLHDQARMLLVSLEKTQQFDEQKYDDFLEIQRNFFNEVLSMLEFSVISKYQFDPTTKLLNRRSANMLLAHEKARIQQTNHSDCCIALGDIDKFKDFNDTYGHDLGDLVLEHVAFIFNTTIRKHDSVARFGGEEFLFVMPNLNLENAKKVIERVRKKLESTPFIHQGNALTITASFGVTQLSHDDDIKNSIKRADVALYTAKNSGRNKTISLDAAEAEAINHNSADSELNQVDA